MQITLSGVVVAQIQAFRNALEKELGAKPTWNMVVKKLLDAWKGNKELATKLKSKDSKIDGMHNENKEYLKMALSRPSAPIMPMMQQTNMPTQMLAPPPPPNLSLPPPKPPLKMLNVEVSEDLKNDFLAELQQAVGNKPSEIMMITAPLEEDEDDPTESMEEYKARMAKRIADPKKAEMERLPEK